MERIDLKNSLLLDILLIICPLVVQIYNIVAGKLGVQPFNGNFITLFALLITSLFVCFRYRGFLLGVGVYRFAVIFALISFPTVLFHLDSDIDNTLRSFCSIGFVPIGFAVGYIISFRMLYVERKNLYSILLLLPVFFVAPMLQSMPMLMEISVFGRDAILAVSIFLPLILALKAKYLKFILLFLVLYWSIISAKRTSFLCILLAFLFLFLDNIRNITLRNVFRNILVVIFIFLASYVTYYRNPEFAGQIDHIVERFEDPEDDGSNRERLEMYETTYSVFFSSSLLEQVFGHGYKAIEKDLFGRPTHNDLLEIMYDYGLLSLVVYLIFLLNLLLYGLKLFFHERNYLLLFTMCNLLLLSMINCMITNPAFVFVNMFCIGFTLNYFQFSKYNCYE